MKSIEKIREQLSSGQTDFTQHALIRMVERNISRDEIAEAGTNAAIIEGDKDYVQMSCMRLRQSPI